MNFLTSDGFCCQWILKHSKKNVFKRLYTAFRKTFPDTIFYHHQLGIIYTSFLKNLRWTFKTSGAGQPLHGFLCQWNLKLFYHQALGSGSLYMAILKHFWMISETFLNIRSWAASTRAFLKHFQILFFPSGAWQPLHRLPHQWGQPPAQLAQLPK